MATPSGLDAELWSAVADQGWLGIHLSEEAGGLGLGTVELAVVAEEMGRACYPGPFLGTVWAATLLADCNVKHPQLEKLTTGEAKGAVALLEPDASWKAGGVNLKAESAGGGYKLSGKKTFVADAVTADLLIVAARSNDGLVLLAIPAKAPGVKITPTEALDATRKLADVELSGVSVSQADVLAVGDKAEAALAHSLDVVALCGCADMLGGMQWILEDSVEYAKTRQQFGKTIGTFQAVQHMCADMLLLTESSRSAVYYAAWALTAEPADGTRAVSIAKAYASDASREVANRGVQVHGGIGFTWEHDLQLFYKRSKGSEILAGDSAFHRERLANLVF